MDQITKIIGMKRSEFESFFDKNKDSKSENSLKPARLIPVSKVNEEVLTSVFLSSIRLIKEFRNLILDNIEMKKTGKLYAYREVKFKIDGKDCRLDGLLLSVVGDEIRDAAILEVKTYGNELTTEQLETYAELAKVLKVPRIITVSNIYVPDHSVIPYEIKKDLKKQVTFYHFSWPYILNYSALCLSNKKLEIVDEDQKEVMKEIIHFYNSDKSGVQVPLQMKNDWSPCVESIGKKTKVDDTNARESVKWWQQVEGYLAWELSNAIEDIVKPICSKELLDYQKKLSFDLSVMTDHHKLKSSFKVERAISSINIEVDIMSKNYEICVVAKAPEEKKNIEKIKWLSKELKLCEKKYEKEYDKSRLKNKDEENEFKKIKENILIQLNYKGSSKPSHCIPLNELEKEQFDKETREIKEFRILLLTSLGNDFSSSSKFYKSLHENFLSFYKTIVQNIEPCEIKAPKVIDGTSVIEAVVPSINSQETEVHIAENVQNDHEVKVEELKAS